MMTFNLNDNDDRRLFAKLLSDFAGYGVSFRLSYEDGHAYVTPVGGSK